jgi:hypothetical protein
MSTRTVDTSAPARLSNEFMIRAAVIGLSGLVAWEVFARVLAPLWLRESLDPNALIEMAIGITGWKAEAVHLLTAVVMFPLAYILVYRPIVTRVMPGMPWPVLGALYGVGLWIVAMYGVASLVAGMPPFLGFQTVAWASLVGHLALAIAIAGASRVLLPASTSM